MSESGIQYALDLSVGSTERLLVFYDFSGMSGRHIGTDEEPDGAGYKYGVIENCDPSVNTGIYSGIVCGFGSSVESAKKFTTGTFLVGDQAHLNESNIKVTGASSLPYSACSVLFDAEFNGKVSDCVLFGSLEKTSSNINGEVITGAKGYNVGINSRGNLFYQGFGQEGDFIHAAKSIDLAKRNVIGFSLGNKSLSLLRFDYLNHQIQKEDFLIDTSFVAANEEFYLGGSQQYFRGGPDGPSGEFKTSNLSLNSFCFLSGALAPSAMFAVGSGLIGDYFSSETSAVLQRRITGYNQTTTYKTGITGYDYEETGSIVFSTGRYMRTGSLIGIGSAAIEEGDRYFAYYSFDSALSDSGVTTFNKEQVGFLHPDSGYQYLPTGEQAFATLGLQDVEGAVLQYTEQEGISGAGTVSVEFFGSRFQTGILSEVSGVIQEPLYETVLDKKSVPISGIRLGGLSEKLKKNYVYYLGERP